MEKTWAEIIVFGIIFSDIEVAGSEFEDALEECDRLAEGADIGERADDFGSLEFGVSGVSGDEYAGKVMASGDDKVWECFIINEEGVEAWSDILDETIFGEERFPFGFAFDGVEVGDEREQGLFLRAEVR